MQAFLPKNRRPKFELQLKVSEQPQLEAIFLFLVLTTPIPQILDLNNVPLVSGTSYIKWHLPSSTSAEHRGRTTKEVIKEHKVIWDYAKTIPVRLTIDRNGMLQDCEIHLEVLQEYSSGAKGGRIALGNVKLNLAEYVEGTDADGEEGITRRYLMQDSKINSTLKITIIMKQIEGDRNFITPPLRTAPVFGGIAGILVGDQGEQDDLGHMPSMSSKSREAGELHDMYRRTLAASWASQAGDLTADACIEDIFAGGNGWGTSLHTSESAINGSHGNSKSVPRQRGDDNASVSDDGGRGGTGEKRYKGFAAFRRRTPSTKPRVAPPSSPKLGGPIHETEHNRMRSFGGMGGRMLEQQVQLGNSDSNRDRRATGYSSGANEVDELAAREDLKSWKLAVS
ncbi:MAG: hypothetical protein M1836_007427 [Candelina mexicana]|nr:MAG: hypothetical protein M1836_007427 [Candelina mexicana]